MKYLESRRAMVDRALDRRVKIDPGRSHVIRRAMRHGLFPGGKRLRPILMLAAGELFGGKPASILPFACAVEMIHTYSLIHDDLPALDDDDVRRGEPATHKVFGEGTALLAGDGLLTEAFHVISGPDVLRRLPASLVIRLINELSHAVGVAGLVGGQAFDLESEDKDVDLATVEYIHVRKTGSLILASIRIGAQIAGATPGDLRRVSRYGEYFGLAFQIADDILDTLGETVAGEKVGSGHSGHKERRKATYPSVVGIAQARERLKDLLDQSVRELAPFGAAGEPLKSIAQYSIARALHESTGPLSEEMNV
jgi:geranylgeranyl diphosphate synthase type II